MTKAKGFEVRNRPDWLYGALPYAYVAIGLGAIAAFGLHLEAAPTLIIVASSDLPNVIGMLSGVLFISTGLVVFNMRLKNRKNLAKLKAEVVAGERAD